MTHFYFFILSLFRGILCHIYFSVVSPVILPVHWNGVALPLQRSFRTLRTLPNSRDDIFSAVERYMYSRDYRNYFCLIDIVFRDSLNKALKRFFLSQVERSL